uniref:CCHC-type domain-containing protein n=1 Tax=Schizaphis graminum TaxID=13262 RepID=A0A2S2NLW0_SCHGA
MSDQEWIDEPEEPTDPDKMSPMSRYLAKALQGTPKTSTKREGGTSPPGTGSVKPARLEAVLLAMRSKICSTRLSTEESLIKTGYDHPAFGFLASVVATMDEFLGDIDKAIDMYRGLPSSSPPRKRKTDGAEEGPLVQKPIMVDASTDTILTPSWWDSESTIEARTVSRRKRAAKTAGTSKVESRDIEVDSAMETDAEAPWSTVVKRGPRRLKTATDPGPPVIAGSSKPIAETKPQAKPNKPPAVLIRPAVGKSYSDTVRTVRSCGLTAQAIGANVTMRETRDGSLLIELAKGWKSPSAAKTIAAAISYKLGDSVGRVSQLGVQTKVEILDLDAVSTAAEVLEALRSAIPGQDEQEASESICDVRIWPTRSGQQIATAKMSRHARAASLITRVTVDWSMCRVRARTLPPERCYRCQGFCHNSRSCTEVDRSGACWRCGLTDHRMKDCTEPEDRCLACEVAGLPKSIHRPGSGACAVRKRAAGSNFKG